MRPFLVCIIGLMFLLTSCFAQRRANRYFNRYFNNNNRDYIFIYQHDGAGEMFPVYLLLKPREKTYDLYYIGGHRGGFLGHYEERGDTLTLMPKYEYGSTTIRAMSNEDKANTFSNVFLRRERELIDITNYQSTDSVLNAYFETEEDRIRYKFRLKK